MVIVDFFFFFFFQAEDGIRDKLVTGVQTCALPIWKRHLVVHASAPGDLRPGDEKTAGAGSLSPLSLRDALAPRPGRELASRRRSAGFHTAQSRQDRPGSASRPE